MSTTRLVASFSVDVLQSQSIPVSVETQMSHR